MPGYTQFYYISHIPNNGKVRKHKEGRKGTTYYKANPEIHFCLYVIYFKADKIQVPMMTSKFTNVRENEWIRKSMSS